MKKLTQTALWTAVVTPLNKDLTVDFKSLKNLIQEQVDAKNGLLILGSTGEALNLDLATKKSIIEYVIALKPSAPIMVGVGGHQLQETREWVSYCNTLAIDCFLMVTPLYSKPGDEGQYAWFKNLMDLSTKPVMLYNVPGRTGKELSLKAVTRLKDHKNYWAIKEASGSVDKFKQYLAASGNQAVYCGDDALTPDFVQNGAVGLVSVASNVWPKETHLYVEQCLNKTFDAKELWEKASNSLFIASNPVPAKAILAKLNRITNNTMMPPLSELDLTDIAPVMDANKQVNTWFKQQGK